MSFHLFIIFSYPTNFSLVVIKLLDPIILQPSSFQIHDIDLDIQTKFARKIWDGIVTIGVPTWSNEKKTTKDYFGFLLHL